MAHEQGLLWGLDDVQVLEKVPILRADDMKSTKKAVKSNFFEDLLQKENSDEEEDSSEEEKEEDSEEDELEEEEDDWLPLALKKKPSSNEMAKKIRA